MAAKLKIFASFDLAKDEDLLKKLVAEAKAPNAKFTVFDRSTRESLVEGAEDGLRERISKCDVLLVLCGVWTHRAPNVTADLHAAQQLHKRYYLVKGRRFSECSRPANARIHDKLFKWSPGAIDQLVSRNI